MIEAIKKILMNVSILNKREKCACLCSLYIDDKQPALELKKELEEIYPDSTIICDPLSLSVSCHIGPHALAVAACRNYLGKKLRFLPFYVIIIIKRR